MGNPFRNKMMRGCYDGAIKTYEANHRNLFLSDGRRRYQGCYGSSFATYFWKGYDGLADGLTRWDRSSKNTTGYAVWCAGRDVRRAEEEDKELRKILGLEEDHGAQEG